VDAALKKLKTCFLRGQRGSWTLPENVADSGAQEHVQLPIVAFPQCWVLHPRLHAARIFLIPQLWPPNHHRKCHARLSIARLPHSAVNGRITFSTLSRTAKAVL
jgi:hypothetical protein